MRGADTPLGSSLHVSLPVPGPAWVNSGHCLVCFRLHSWHTLQSVLFPHQRGCAAVLLLPEPLPDCCVPRAKCLPAAEPVRTGMLWVDTVMWEGLIPTEHSSFGPGTLCQLSLFSPQQGTYYTQPLYAAPPHVIHHTTVVQPNGMPATVYPAPIPPPRGNGVTMGMVAGTTMAMSAGKSLFLRCLPCGVP